MLLSPGGSIGLLSIPAEFFMWPLHVTWQLGSERKCSQYTKRKEAKLLVLLWPGLEVPQSHFTYSPGQTSHVARPGIRAWILASPPQEWHVSTRSGGVVGLHLQTITSPHKGSNLKSLPWLTRVGPHLPPPLPSLLLSLPSYHTDHLALLQIRKSCFHFGVSVLLFLFPRMFLP